MQSHKHRNLPNFLSATLTVDGLYPLKTIFKAAVDLINLIFQNSRWAIKHRRHKTDNYGFQKPTPQEIL
jgi:hypothetical protein